MIRTRAALALATFGLLSTVAVPIANASNGEKRDGTELLAVASDRTAFADWAVSGTEKQKLLHAAPLLRRFGKGSEAQFRSFSPNEQAELMSVLTDQALFVGTDPSDAPVAGASADGEADVKGTYCQVGVYDAGTDDLPTANTYGSLGFDGCVPQVFAPSTQSTGGCKDKSKRERRRLFGFLYTAWELKDYFHWCYNLGVVSGYSGYYTVTATFPYTTDGPLADEVVNGVTNYHRHTGYVFKVSVLGQDLRAITASINVVMNGTGSWHANGAHT